MSDRKATGDSGAAVAKKPRVRKRKRRFEPTEKLPTPPPDPHELGAKASKRKSLDGEAAAGNNEESSPQRLRSADSSRRVSSDGALAYAAAFAGTEEAFQHLDKLHALMEQILELRERNARLFRRVRELERFKALRRLELTGTYRVPAEPPEEDVGFAESLLSAMLESSASSSSNQSAPAAAEAPRVRSFRAPMARQRSRSIGTEAQLGPVGPAKRASCHLQYTPVPLSKSSKRNSLAGPLAFAQPKVSKWTKVKAAFKWERAGLGTGGTSALSNVVLEALEHDTARFLRIPEGHDPAAGNAATTPAGSSPRTAEHSGPPSPGTISSSSSTDDIYGLHKRALAARSSVRESEEDPTRRRSLDGDFIIPQHIQYATQHLRDSGNRRFEKGHKTPWGMVKDIIQSRRENVRRSAPRGSLRSEDGYSLSSIESSDMIHEMLAAEYGGRPRVQVTTSEGSLAGGASRSPSGPSQCGSGEIVDLATRRLTPMLTITVPSSEELRSASTPESPSPPASRQHHRHHHHSQQLDSHSTDERSPSEDPDAGAASPTGRRNGQASQPLLRERRCSAAGATTPGAHERPRLQLQRQDSKWSKVKWAFLAGTTSVPPSPSRTSSFFDETDGGGSYSASAEDLENNGGTSPTTQTDIQRNYQLLHDKLSVEFYRKLAEWERLKNGQSGGGGRGAGSPKDKDSANALLMGEEQLTPEFKKKLQEWKRMKKPAPSGSTSPEHPIFRRRLTDWQIWRNPAKSDGKASEQTGEPGKAHLSEDFLKKMEDWKKIKSGRSDEEQSSCGRRDSAEAIYQSRNFGQRWKTLDEKEFQPLDRVIDMIEREQQRLERQREKLLGKKSRMDEMSRVIDLTPPKREVLVHTSSGYYRFEGISQEFTRKLYEWEKSQGIAPESSTFQLLNPAYKLVADDKKIESSREKDSRSMKRSKSMSSVVESSIREEAPIRQPSSLSLNDVVNLENEAKLRIDSKQTIGEEEMSEELPLDDSEPEAVIVDIEDVIEETASPMAKLQPQQTPVYCVTTSETTSIAVPLGTVTASHEPSPVILIQAGEPHHRLRKNYRYLQEAETYDDDRADAALKNLHEAGEPSHEEIRKSCRLFEPSEIKICETIIEEDAPSSNIGEESSCDADMPSDERSPEAANDDSSEELTICENPESDATDSRRDEENYADCSQTSSDAQNQTFKTSFSSSLKHEDEAREIIVADNPRGPLPQNGANEEIPREKEPNEAVITVKSDIRQKKVLKTRRLTDTQVGYKWRQPPQKAEETSPEPSDALTVSPFPETPSVERIIINESTLNKIVVPTASNERISSIGTTSDVKKSLSSGSVEEAESRYRRLSSKSESKSVFVKTKRIIFSPFSRRNSKDKPTATTSPPAAPKESEPEAPVEAKPPEAAASTANPTADLAGCIQRSKSSSECPTERRPPLPQSPILARKEYRRSSPKETAPSIRAMIQRYNQKLQEDAGSPASSGSGSPIWRSPASERRVRSQMERYQEEVRRAICPADRQRLEKSASAGLIRGSGQRPEILKSTSADFSRRADFPEAAAADEEEEARPPAQPPPERRKNSLQNMSPEIHSNIRQCLVQEFKTLPIKGAESRRNSSEGKSIADDSPSSSLAAPSTSSGKLSPDLLQKLNALSSASPCQKREHQSASSANSSPLRVRAARIKKARDDFLSRGPSCRSHEPSVEQEAGHGDFVKSASAGMINVDPRTYERLRTSEQRPGAYGEVAGALSKIASKFRRARLKRTKERDPKMSTVSMLCRQSLLVDLPTAEGSKSCPTSPQPHRDDEDKTKGKMFRDSN